MRRDQIGAGLLGATEEEADGCRFCHAKGVQFDLKGREWWHPAVNCCPPSALLQVVWRQRDLEIARLKLDRAPDDAKASHQQVLADVEEDARDAIAAFRRLARDEDGLVEAIRVAREAGFSDPGNWSAARVALFKAARNHP